MKTLPVISCVSYLNSQPFIYGISEKLRDTFSLNLDTPVEVARKLQDGKAQIGLVPVVAIPGIPNAKVVSGFCIGANGPVRSVTLLSRVPLNQVRTIIPDAESMTSNMLVRILSREYWQIDPEFISPQMVSANDIRDEVAAVVIGDRSLKLRDNFEYVYDLAGEWKKFTGLPFVFACWVSVSDINASNRSAFENALRYGIENIPAVIRNLEGSSSYREMAEDYLTSCIQYDLDEPKKKGMERFLNYCKNNVTAPMRNLM